MRSAHTPSPRMHLISGSVTNGIIGAMLIPTGIPVSARVRIARRRRAGAAACGSSVREMAGPSVVIVKAAVAWL